MKKTTRMEYAVMLDLLEDDSGNGRFVWWTATHSPLPQYLVLQIVFHIQQYFASNLNAYHLQIRTVETSHTGLLKL